MKRPAVPPLRAISLIGNALGLVLLAFLCVRTVPLVALETGDRAPLRFEAGERTERTVLLIVIDALRLDTALDARTMPTLAALAALATPDTFRELRVIQPVPSTVGALPAMVEGRAVPANAALLDLTPQPASGGGLLAALHRAGQPAQVGGTALWTGLYRRWLGPGVSIDGMPNAGTDSLVLRWAMHRLQAIGAPPLLIVHLGRLDATAHRHGVGEVYRETARGIDDDVARLIERARASGRTVLITSDHGVTLDGGHAGGEMSVRAVPVFGLGAALDLGDGEPQTRIATVLARWLGYRVPSSAHPRTPPSGEAALGERPGPFASGAGSTVATLVFIGMTTVLAWRGLSRLALFGTDRQVATVWSAALWVCVAVAVAVGPQVGAVMATGALALPHVRRSVRGRTGAADRAMPAHAAAPLVVWPLAVGALVAVTEIAGTVSGHALLVRTALFAILALVLVAWIRQATGQRSGPPRHRPPVAAIVALAVTLAVAAIAGGLLGGPALSGATLLAGFGAWALAGGRDSVLTGVVCIAALTALSHLAGESASLSSLDVSLAHRAAASPGGVASAVGVALLRLFWLGGVWVIAWRAGQVAATGENVLPLDTLRGAAQTSLASMLVFAGLSVFGWPTHAVMYGASLGGLVQEAALWIGLAGTMIVVTVFARYRHPGRTRQPVA